MPTKKKRTMQQSRYILRLHHLGGVGARDRARCEYSPSTARGALTADYGCKAGVVVAGGLSDEELEARLFCQEREERGLRDAQASGNRNSGYPAARDLPVALAL